MTPTALAILFTEGAHTEERTMRTIPGYIADHEQADETYIPTINATGAQLATAVKHETDRRRHAALHRLMREFRQCGGKDSDRIGDVLTNLLVH
jgi:hypothetical protein